MTRRNLWIVLTLGLCGLSLLTPTPNHAAGEAQIVEEALRAQKALEQYGQQVAHSMPAKTVTFALVRGHSLQSLERFEIQFITSRQDLISKRNVRASTIWQAKVCTTQLRDIMGTFRLALVTGLLTDLTGEPQQIAVCVR